MRKGYTARNPPRRIGSTVRTPGTYAGDLDPHEARVILGEYPCHTPSNHHYHLRQRVDELMKRVM